MSSTAVSPASTLSSPLLQFMMDLLKRGIEEGRKREHEAFSMMLLQKVKAGLAPEDAETSELLETPELHDIQEELAGINTAPDELEAWEKQLTASLLEKQRDFADAEVLRRSAQELSPAVYATQPASGPTMVDKNGRRRPIVPDPKMSDSSE